MPKALRNFRLWRGLAAVTGVILAVAIFLTSLLFRWAGNVNIFLGVEIPTVEASGDTLYYDVGYEMNADGQAKMIADSDRHDVQTMEEGSVLLKNTDNALPLASTERRVTLFGRATADPYYKGRSGGASRDGSRQVSLYSALKAEGFAINETMYEAYKNSSKKRELEESTGKNTGTYPTSIGEEDGAFYTDELKNSYANDYNDVAIVMFAREAGEGGDISQRDEDGLPGLAFHPQEKALLEMIVASGKFKKTVLLVNSAWAMELGYLFEEKYGIDAALWIGGPALKGFTGVANVLVGKADPSGRLVDTYAANSMSSAAVQNSASHRFTNFNRSYLIQAEGIYAGYKYYETRYQDQVLGINNAGGAAGKFASTGDGWNYAEEMVFPFGYGGSYAKFTQKLESVIWDKEKHEVTATVKVTYNGVPSGSSYTGKSKSAVQLYVQLPWKSGQAEKSAIQLIGFGKSRALDATDSEDTVTITVDDYLFATYDANAVNGADTSKKGCYVFDAGDYFFAIGDDCHDALNNVLAAREETGMFDIFGNAAAGDADKAHKENLAELDNKTYATSRENKGAVVSNLFDNVDYNYWVKDTVTYLTRGDWNTFPKTYGSLTATQEMIDFYNDKSWKVPENAPSYDSFKQGTAANGVKIKFYELKDLEWDNPDWETFLDQLTIQQMTNMTGEDFGQKAITDKDNTKSVGKPPNKNSDGPSGAQGGYRYGNKGSATQHVNEVVAASTFNPELLRERGKFIACDCAFTKTTQIWGPGANLHRTPFSGRNFEYYSEDGIMSYICGALQTSEMQKYGTNAAIKHFAGNDQETGREDMHNFMTEQHLRQGPLKGFEGAFTADGGALATMMSYTSFGMHSDMYSDNGVLTGVVRNEWGFKGVTITDNVNNNTSVNAVEALVAGTDTFNAGVQKGKDINKYLTDNKDGYVLSCLRLANKRFFYAMSRSTLVNGLTADTVVEDFVPWWQPTLQAVCAVIGIALAAFIVLYALAKFVFAKETDEKVEEA